MRHVKSCGNTCMLASSLPLSDKNVLSVFHRRTLWPNNAISQHFRPTQKRSVALNYYVLARRSSTNHSTQHSALMQKYWQNTSYQLGGMNNWLYAVMKISAHWFNIYSHIREGKTRLSPTYSSFAPSNSDWWPCGKGGDADRVNI